MGEYQTNVVTKFNEEIDSMKQRIIDIDNQIDDIDSTLSKLDDDPSNGLVHTVARAALEATKKALNDEKQKLQNTIKLYEGIRNETSDLIDRIIREIDECDTDFAGAFNRINNEIGSFISELCSIMEEIGTGTVTNRFGVTGTVYNENNSVNKFIKTIGWSISDDVRVASHHLLQQQAHIALVGQDYGGEVISRLLIEDVDTVTGMRIAFGPEILTDSQLALSQKRYEDLMRIYNNVGATWFNYRDIDGISAPRDFADTWRGHYGTDFTSPDGITRAIMAGKVVYTGLSGSTSSGNGYMVMVEHKVVNPANLSESTTIYTHYSHGTGEFYVQEGDYVRPRSRLMDEGTTGSSTGAHTHIGIFTNNNDTTRPFGYWEDEPKNNGTAPVHQYYYDSHTQGRFFNYDKIFSTYGTLFFKEYEDNVAN